MLSQDELVPAYREIADAYERRGQGQLRDRFLVLAADAALGAGQPHEAETLRQRLLRASPHHLLKPYATFAQAMESPDLLAYVQDLRKHYPATVTADLLATLRREHAAQPATTPMSDREIDVSVTAPLPPIYKLRPQEDDTIRESPALPPTMPPGTRPPVLPIPLASPLNTARPKPAAVSARGRAPTPPRPVLNTTRAPSPPIRLSSPPDIAFLDDEDDEPEHGSWLAALLFGVVTAAGLGLLLHTLAGPLFSGR